MALKGIKVIEVAGLAPAPFCGMIFSDFGANVIRVDKPGQPPLDNLTRGKRSISIDLKRDAGKSIFRKLCSNADVLIEPFRPGVMERLDLGPKQILDLNKRLIYARLSGFGQDGLYAKRAGHDLNYLAISGVLSVLTKGMQPTAPINLLADFAGGGLICALGILMALHERQTSKLGQVIDVSMVEGTRYVASYLWHTKKSDEPTSAFIWPKSSCKEANLLDGGAHFYNCYQTKDNRWLSVACIEPQFYQRFLDVLGESNDKFSQFDVDKWPEYKKCLANIFATKTLDEWVKLFDEADACVEPVLEMDAVNQHPSTTTLNLQSPKSNRQPFLDDGSPAPAPYLSRTPANTLGRKPKFSSEHTAEVLSDIGYSPSEISKLAKDRVVECGLDSKL